MRVFFSLSLSFHFIQLKYQVPFIDYNIPQNRKLKRFTAVAHAIYCSITAIQHENAFIHANIQNGRYKTSEY